MAADWTVLTLGLAALLLAMLVVTPMRSGTHVWPTWDFVLSTRVETRRRYEVFEASLGDELAALRATLRLAQREGESGDVREAGRALEVAARCVARHVCALRERLRLWSDAARVLGAVCPTGRLEAFAFRAWKLRAVTAAETLVRLALDVAHRFRLRISVVSYGLRLVQRGFACAPAGAGADQVTLGRRLRELYTLGGDLGVLHEASLGLFRALLVSIDEQRSSPKA